MEGEAALYKELKTVLLSIKEIKHVGLFNNQYEREREEKQLILPAVFVQIQGTQFRDRGAGLKLQDYIATVTLHIGFNSKATDDIKILTLKQTIYRAIHGFRPITESQNLGVLKRVDERQNFDHDNLHLYEQDYTCLIQDFDADKSEQREFTLNPNITVDIVQNLD